MDIIPVIDIQDGIAVQVRRGEPQKFYPLESILVDSADPLSVLQALQEKLMCSIFYVIDLNARHREGDNFKIIKKMGAIDGVNILVDAGVDTVQSARQLMEMGSVKSIVGTKHLDSIQQAIRILETIGIDNVIFNLQMEQYEVYANSAEVRRLKPIEIIYQLWDYGQKEFILIELFTIGTVQGVHGHFLQFLHDIIERFKGIKVITGGGIRDVQDLVTLKDIGVSGAMLGTALHKGIITAEDIAVL